MNTSVVNTTLSNITGSYLADNGHVASCSSPPTQDDETLKTFSFVMNVIIVGTLCISGSVCNILSILTLQQDRHKLSMSVLLQGLAGSDTIFLSYNFVYTMLRSVYPYNGGLEAVHRASPYIVAYVLPFGWMAQTSTIWIVMLVTIDRYVAVCHPFRSSRWCTLKHARIAVVLVWIASILFNFPRFFYYHQQEFGSTRGNSSSTFVAHMHVTSEFWAKYRTVYHIFMTMVFLFVIPLPVLVTLNVKLIREIAQARRRSLQLTGSSSERDTITVTINLIAVVTVFVICETPDFIASIITLEYFCIDKVFLEYFLCVKEFLLVLNASTNFFIYCLFYNKFRCLLIHLLCSRFLKDEYPLSETERETNRISKGYISPTQSHLCDRLLLEDLNHTSSTKL